jgi:hypothetical protein
MREPNQITGANAGERLRFAVKSRIVLHHRTGVAQFHRSPKTPVALLSGLW